MIFTLALRNLFHDGIRFVGTLVGIGFAIILVTVQLGLYLGFSRQITGMVDHADADLWIVRKGTPSFEQASALDGGERQIAMATEGVASVASLLVSFLEWKKPNGEASTIVVVGTPRTGGLAPWNIVEGSVADLATPDGVIVDQTYLEDLGVKGRGDTAQIEGRTVRVAALTKGIRAFTTTPYVFMTPERARTLVGGGSLDATHLLVRVGQGQNPEVVRNRLAERLPDAEVVTQAAFAERSRNYWLFSTGAGFALIAGAILGLIVGTVIVAQTLYASTKDHIDEFATLRAIGATSRYIHKVILCQALISAAIGFSIAAFAGVGVVYLTADSVLPIILTIPLLFGLLGLTVLMCVISAMAAIAKVTRIDPAMVFAR
jgi:putative ABC transport system permease protein